MLQWVQWSELASNVPCILLPSLQALGFDCWSRAPGRVEGMHSIERCVDLCTEPSYEEFCVRPFWSVVFGDSSVLFLFQRKDVFSDKLAHVDSWQRSFLLSSRGMWTNLIQCTSEVPSRQGESLNVAHASAICLYELSRDMDKPKKVARDSRILIVCAWFMMVCTNQKVRDRTIFGARARGQQLSMAQDYEVDSASQQLC